jgi:outer membrane protein
MKNINKLSAIILLIFIFINPAKSDDKVAFINVDLLIKNSNIGKNVLKNIDDLNNKNLTLLKKRNNKLKELEVEIKNKKNIISNDEYIKELKIFEQKINDFNLEKNKIVKEFKDFREKELDNLFRLFSPIISNYMKENSINVLFDSKNILMGNVDSNKTNDILEIINNEIK